MIGGAVAQIGAGSGAAQAAALVGLIVFLVLFPPFLLWLRELYRWLRFPDQRTSFLTVKWVVLTIPSLPILWGFPVLLLVFGSVLLMGRQWFRTRAAKEMNRVAAFSSATHGFGRSRVREDTAFDRQSVASTLGISILPSEDLVSSYDVAREDASLYEEAGWAVQRYTYEVEGPTLGRGWGFVARGEGDVSVWFLGSEYGFSKNFGEFKVEEFESSEFGQLEAVETFHLL